MKVISGAMINKEELTRAIDAISFLRNFKELFCAESELLFSKAHLWCFEAGDMVMKVGDSSGSILLVISGQVAIQSKEGTVLGRLTAGEWLGDLTLFDLASRTANVEVENRSAKLLMVPKNLLHPSDDNFSDEAKIYFYRHLFQGIRWKLEKAKAATAVQDPMLTEALTDLARISLNNLTVFEWRDILTRLSLLLTQFNVSSKPLDA